VLRLGAPAGMNENNKVDEEQGAEKEVTREGERRGKRRGYRSGSRAAYFC